MFDHELSKRTGDRVRAENKECFLNAFRGMTECGQDAHYVEGFAVPGEFPIIAAHAWLEVDGKIIDPTPAYQSGNHEYFVAARYSQAHALAGAIHNDSVLPIEDLEIMRSECVRDAYSRAHKHAYGMTPDEMRARLMEVSP